MVTVKRCESGPGVQCPGGIIVIFDLQDGAAGARVHGPLAECPDDGAAMTIAAMVRPGLHPEQGDPAFLDNRQSSCHRLAVDRCDREPPGR